MLWPKNNLNQQYSDSRSSVLAPRSWMQSAPAAIVALLFLYSAANKLASLLIVGRGASLYRLDVTIIVIAYELLLGILLIGWGTDRRVKKLAFATMAVYAALSLRYLRYESVQDCGCGLPNFLSPTHPLLLLFRNTAFAGLALLPLLTQSQNNDSTLIHSARSGRLSMWLAGALAIQLGALAVRSDGRVLANSVAMSASMRKPVLISNSVSLLAQRAFGQTVAELLVVYVSPNCARCIDSCAEIRDLIGKASARGVNVLVVTSGAGEEGSGYATRCPVDATEANDARFEVARAIGATETPYFAAIEGGHALVATGYTKVSHWVDAFNILETPDQ